MKASMRRNGQRELSGREYRVIKQLVASGHSDKAIAEMVGRTTKSVSSIKHYYKMTRHPSVVQGTPAYPPDKKQKALQYIEKWITEDKLSASMMADRLKVLLPPGVDKKTINTWIRKFMPKNVGVEHRKNATWRKNAGIRQTQLRNARARRQKNAAEHAENSCV